MMTESPTRIRWLMVVVLFWGQVLMYVDRLNISVAAKYIMPEYGLSDVQMGWIFSAFVLGYSFGLLPGGWLNDRLGPRRVLAFAIVWWSLFTMVTAIAGDWFVSSLVGVIGSFTIVRLMIGIGEAVGQPSSTRMIASWLPPQERGLALGICASGSMFGAAITPPLVAWLMVTFGWREAFYLAGAIGFVLAWIWYVVGRDRPEEHPRINAAELQYIAQTSALATPQKLEARSVPWGALLGRRDLWCLATAAFCVGYVVFLYLSWLYLYLVNVRGFSVLSGGAYTMAPFLAGCAGSLIGGWLTDHLSHRYGKRVGRCGIGVSCLLMAGGSILGGAAVQDPHLAVLLLSLGAGALFAGVPASYAAVIDLARDYAGTASGLLLTGATLGGVLSPTLTPLIAQQYGWEYALYVGAVSIMVGSLLWLGVHPEQAIEFREEPSLSPGSAVRQEA
jgi:ACS family glucarate transporter-like MFS transporter